MPPFTQYTQAAPACVCLGRGYVIDGAGDFAACDCEAAAAWIAAAPVAVVESAPAAAAPIAAGKVRRSTSVPGLSYETDVRGGVIYLSP